MYLNYETLILQNGTIIFWLHCSSLAPNFFCGDGKFCNSATKTVLSMKNYQSSICYLLEKLVCVLVEGQMNY